VHSNAQEVTSPFCCTGDEGIVRCLLSYQRWQALSKKCARLAQ